LPLFIKEPNEIIEDREEELKLTVEFQNFDKDGTIYPYF